MLLILKRIKMKFFIYKEKQSWNILDVKNLLLLIKNKRKNIVYGVKILRCYPSPTIIEHANNENIVMVVIGSWDLNTLQKQESGFLFFIFASYIKMKYPNTPIILRYITLKIVIFSGFYFESISILGDG